jgi:hypothetical protein
MKDQLVSFETAKLAKEKGFDILCTKMFSHDVDYMKAPNVGDVIKFHDGDKNECFCDPYNWNGTKSPTSMKYYSVSTQSLLQRWLREKHDIHIKMIPCKEKSSTFYQSEVDGMGTGCLVDDVCTDDDSYENILEISIQKALKLIQIRN